MQRAGEAVLLHVPGHDEGNGDHTRSTGSWLTGTHIKRTEGSDLRAGVSVDQLIAMQNKRDTPMPSLELAILPNSVTGGCDTGYSCAYGNTLTAYLVCEDRLMHVPSRQLRGERGPMSGKPVRPVPFVLVDVPEIDGERDQFP